ncbi:relaxase domain-containing protein [Planobispora takensis]|uniref:TrwC relaxase domain-containing protein n=1 Tax=Planobispora takensis TaxID=1367882 RepID=A0A8J3T1C3_9ACTN|nr:relaxase domain-containing protein [Planobispora takensis]GII03297.1 hypothetical protein Pta02_53050 [Planobispora takensis]
MAWITDLGPSAVQVRYRLRGGAMCDRRRSVDGPPRPIDAAPVGGHREILYDLPGARDPVWFGSALTCFAITPGTPLTVDRHVQAAAFMAGRHPGTGQTLVEGCDHTRNRGFDLALAAPADVNALYARSHRAADIADRFAAAVTAGAAHLEQRITGGSRCAGLLGWITWHLTAPRSAGMPPRPCLHAHLVIAALMWGPGGHWRDITGPERAHLRLCAASADRHIAAHLRQAMAGHPRVPG